jgi:hypothetical protein
MKAKRKNRKAKRKVSAKLKAMRALRNAGGASDRLAQLLMKRAESAGVTDRQIAMCLTDSDLIYQGRHGGRRTVYRGRKRT